MALDTGNTVDRAYDETYTFLCSLERFGILLGLDNIRSLLAKLGNPQLRFPVVHIAGSNGKGSVAAIVTAILRSAGYRTALYTSPHLNDFRERIRIDGALVSKEAVIRAAEKVREVYDPEKTTFFEFTTAVAFLCIAEERPDIAIVEVGLGGRLDATNTVNPLVTVITDISREHEDYLGKGIESVAREKAGVIKVGVPVVSGAVRKAARKVIRETAVSRDAPLLEFGRDFTAVPSADRSFTFHGPGRYLENLNSALAGSHQVKNAALAVAVIEELNRRGFTVGEDAIRRGTAAARFPGRFEQVAEKPDVIIDAAHTPESIRLLKSTFTKLYPGVRPLVITGMLAEKNWREMAKILATMADRVMCVPPQGNRALDPAMLADEFARHGISARIAPTVEEGFRDVMEIAEPGDVVLAVGSLYMIGPVRRECGLPDE